MRVSSYSKAQGMIGAIEQRDMVNSGVRDTKDTDLRSEVGCTVQASCLIASPL